MHFSNATVFGFFDARHHSGLKGVSFFDQFVNTLGVRPFDVG